MSERLKVMTAMNAHVRRKCEECPYNGSAMDCVDRMIGDIVDVIKHMQRVEDAIREYLDDLREGA